MVNQIKGINGFIKPQADQEEKKEVKVIKKESLSKPDAISLSDEAKNMALARKISKTAGYLLREDKINLAKKRINSSFYDNKLEEIAKNILKEIF